MNEFLKVVCMVFTVVTLKFGDFQTFVLVRVKLAPHIIFIFHHNVRKLHVIYENYRLFPLALYFINLFREYITAPSCACN